ncbi:signal peptidase I [Pontibacillus halophilus JSM 076056 = DSM 19796]|uniref:Signal peptidase I n=1 Tax=Pontibacillus halophilus JSM 076056 = DSM 19796 TaxID=1385510 RepID=A0A0A5GIU9_9BACI|nr:signal peptidase I [Pontibacillus halophilus]KGX93186.1 signal peptidase I [Pontibacillus halophilus JSM 076056 = DSM 19796]
MARKKQEWFDWIKAIGIAALLAIVIRMFVFAPIVVDGPSMLPTLENGDHMIVNKLSYTFGDPERFDVVVFHATENKDYIKRVIGLPGEHVEYVEDTLYVNGQAVNEPYISEQINALPKGNKYTFDFNLEELPGGYEEIPDGHVLVLGDNRGNSTDSRMLGLIEVEELVGETSFTYWPLGRIGIH